jgi:trimethylguanosine synthase
MTHTASATGAPDGVYNYTTLDEVPPLIAKYWQQRHNIFSKYDDGVWLTDDGWFGVTPEPIAKYPSPYTWFQLMSRR